MTITKEQAEQIFDLLEGYDDQARIHWDYSGRGMYGRECLGFEVQKPSMVGAAVGTVLAGTDEDAMEIMESSQQDNMGHNYIVYFPYIKV